MNRLAVHHSSATPEWYTPPAILELVRAVAPIGLDPCSSGRDHVAAATSYVWPERDGLAESWLGHGLVFVNPPYGRVIPDWTRKIAAAAVEGAEVIALIPARPDTRWFHRDVWPLAAAILWWRGRIKFIGAPNSAPFPTAIAYYGERADRFAAAFRGRGWITQEHSTTEG